MSKTLSTVLAGITLAGILTPAPARAADPSLGAWAADASAELPSFPGNGSVSSLTGFLVLGDTSTTAGMPDTPPLNVQGPLNIGLGAGGVQYAEPTCELGSATGKISIDSSDYDLRYVRVGAIAMVVATDEDEAFFGTAIFVPESRAASGCTTTPVDDMNVRLIGGGEHIRTAA